MRSASGIAVPFVTINPNINNINGIKFWDPSKVGEEMQLQSNRAYNEENVSPFLFCLLKTC